MQRKVLGRGLGALIPDSEEISENNITYIPVERVYPNRYQPRKVFDEKKIEELACSIKEKGVIQPIIVQRKGNGYYELIAGERRWRAIQKIGIDRIPALIRDVSDSEAIELALTENIHREDLNPIEEALVYKQLIEEFHLTQEEISKRVGKERSSISNYLRILKLPTIIREDINNDLLSMGHARAIVGIDSPEEQKKLRDIILKKGMSVREVEAYIRNKKNNGQIKQEKQRDIFLLKGEEELQRDLGTKVKIIRGRRGGRIEVYFYSDEDLERIIGLIENKGGE
ncbi:MAG: ParB/RepB/Spo0J family partition protein [Nitrospinae bacterium]|nr:ParB/RepB/Spo0J family partition protein [Nitrospinota bacterium]